MCSRCALFETTIVNKSHKINTELSRDLLFLVIMRSIVVLIFVGLVLTTICKAVNENGKAVKKFVKHHTLSKYFLYMFNISTL